MLSRILVSFVALTISLSTAKADEPKTPAPQIHKAGQAVPAETQGPRNENNEVKAEEPNPIPYSILVSKYLKSHINNNMSQVLLNSVNNALDTAKKFPPQDQDHFFDWRKHPEKVQGKHVVMLLTESTDPQVQELLKKNHIMLPDSADSFSTTATVTDTQGKGHRIVMSFLLADRIMYHGRVKRDDNIVRMIGATAREVFGGIPALLESDISKTEPMDDASVKAREVRKFDSGAQFFERISASDSFKNLPEEMRNDVMSALEREKKSKAEWEKTE